MRIVAPGETERFAPSRTLTRVIHDENGQDAWAAVVAHVDKNAHLVADEHRAYDDLIGLVKMTRVNHSLQYQEDGTNTNVIESFFSRVERAYSGINHRYSKKYLDWYMAMIAWKEDTRYMGLRWQFADLLQTITNRPTSRNLCGYWQGASQRIPEQVWNQEPTSPQRLISQSLRLPSRVPAWRTSPCFNRPSIVAENLLAKAVSSPFISMLSPSLMVNCRAISADVMGRSACLTIPKAT